MIMTGRFITLEGGEGAGKSTQIPRLVSVLRDLGFEATTTREPGGSLGAEEIRSLVVNGDPGRWGAMTEALLHTAARRDHLERTVWPALEHGVWVICDRFFDSTVAYQGWGHGLGADAMWALQSVALGDFRPDLTLILDIPVEIGLARADARRGAETRYESMTRDFHRRLRDGYLKIAEGEPERCVVIDATRSVDEVAAEIHAVVRSRFSPGSSA